MKKEICDLVNLTKYRHFRQSVVNTDRKARAINAVASPASSQLAMIKTLSMFLTESELALIHVNCGIDGDEYEYANPLRFVAEDELVKLGLSDVKAKRIKEIYPAVRHPEPAKW